jgi:uncharacterized protein YndB with AHSA1/START domain
MLRGDWGGTVGVLSHPLSENSLCAGWRDLFLLGNIMPRTVTMAVRLPCTAARLYRMYLDPKLHAAFTGAPVTIAARAGAAFKAFGGAISGTILQVVPNRLIVQSWRSREFARRDLDSTLVLAFWPDKDGGRIELTHANVADSDFAGVSEGWSKYYWIPWRDYLNRAEKKA